MSKREIVEHFELETEQVKELLKRFRRRKRRIAAGIPPRPKGCLRKDTAPGNIVAEQANEINRLIEQTALEFSAIDRKKVRPQFKKQAIYTNREDCRVSAM